MRARELPFVGDRGAVPFSISDICQWAAVLSCGVGIVLYIHWSLHWPLIWDMQVMHYVSFLIDRGWAPYRQIGDMNMPGAYLVEGWALHLFGDQDTGWRLYDFLLCAVLTGATTIISSKYDWRAGFIAGTLFTLGHGAEGPINAGQRDQVIALALVVGYAFTFEAVRRNQAWLMLPAGLAIALATSIKPTVLLAGPLLLVILLFELRRREIPFTAYIAWAVLGYATVAAILAVFLLSHGSMQAFIYDLTKVLPHYATLKSRSRLEVLASTFARPVLLYVSYALFTLAFVRVWNWEQAGILSGVFIGLLNYFAQNGATQHRYTLTAFVLLWATIQIFGVCSRSGQVKVLGTVGVLLALLLVIPRFLHSIRQYKSSDPFSESLEKDLGQIGTGRLQGNIQCLDIVDGCLNALYHLKIVQSTGSTGDLLLFLQQHAPVVDRARAEFWTKIQANPPAVFVLSNVTFVVQDRTFNNVNAWPRFASYLAQNYELVRQRAFPPDVPPTADPAAANLYPAYRIYIRRGTLGVAR